MDLLPPAREVGQVKLKLQMKNHPWDTEIFDKSKNLSSKTWRFNFRNYELINENLKSEVGSSSYSYKRRADPKKRQFNI